MFSLPHCSILVVVSRVHASVLTDHCFARESDYQQGLHFLKNVTLLGSQRESRGRSSVTQCKGQGCKSSIAMSDRRSQKSIDPSRLGRVPKRERREERELQSVPKSQENEESDGNRGGTWSVRRA